jgi:hypothetical protein
MSARTNIYATCETLKLCYSLQALEYARCPTFALTFDMPQPSFRFSTGFQDEETAEYLSSLYLGLHKVDAKDWERLRSEVGEVYFKGFYTPFHGWGQELESFVSEPSGNQLLTRSKVLEELRASLLRSQFLKTKLHVKVEPDQSRTGNSPPGTILADRSRQPRSEPYSSGSIDHGELQRNAPFGKQILHHKD